MIGLGTNFIINNHVILILKRQNKTTKQRSNVTTFRRSLTKNKRIQSDPRCRTPARCCRRGMHAFIYIYKIYIFGNKERRKSSATSRSGRDPDDGGNKKRCHRCQGHCIGFPLGSQIDDHRVLILQPRQWNYLPSWLLPTSVLLNIDLRPCSLHVGQGVGSGS